MSLTTPSLHVPHHRVPFPTWIRNHLSWMLVGLVALAAVAVLTITLVDSDSGTDVAPATLPFDPDRGSINAIEHRSAVGGAAAGVGSGAASSPAGSLSDGSIRAIEHRAANQGR
jgi:hypothetical protein